MGALFEGANAIATVDWSTLVNESMFSPLVTGITTILPVVIAVTIPLLVIRKGWSFLKGNIYSA